MKISEETLLDEDETERKKRTCIVDNNEWVPTRWVERAYLWICRASNNLQIRENGTWEVSIGTCLKKSRMYFFDSIILRGSIWNNFDGPWFVMVEMEDFRKKQ